MALVPGPNVLGYLFTFTVVGHFLAWRGAVNALHGVAWTIVPNPALTELHRAFSLDPGTRHRVLREVAHRLHMPRMARFVERMARTPARPKRSDILDPVTLGELARRLDCPVEGDAAIEIRRVAKLEDAGPGDLTFLANPKYASKLAGTRASAVIMNGEDLLGALRGDPQPLPVSDVCEGRAGAGAGAGA